MSKFNDFITELSKVSHLQESSEIKDYFDKVSDFLFHHLAIKAGKDIYTFIEVEFYYYNEKSIFKGSSLYNCTYPRSRKAGQLFWHLSGMDICFESKEEDRYFGGILIRSLKKGEEIFAGPMRCSDVLLNSCATELPTLIEYESNFGYESKTAFRYGIEADKNEKCNDLNMKFRYFIPQEKWTRTRYNVLVEDKGTGGYKKLEKKIDYYSAQPDK